MILEEKRSTGLVVSFRQIDHGSYCGGSVKIVVKEIIPYY